MAEHLLRVYRHVDGRKIEVYADCKIRRNFSPYDRGPGTPSTDEWPVLYRRDVPNLSDEEWLAAPIESGWSAE